MKRRLGVALIAFGVLALGIGGYTQREAVDLTLLLIGSVAGLLLILAGAFLMQQKGSKK